jgi:hypothetical protein
MTKEELMNRDENEITVSALSSAKTFANYKELDSFVDSIPNVYGPLEWAAREKRDALKGGGTPPPSDPPVPKLPTPFDDRVAALVREEEEVETVYAESKDAWLSLLQESRVEFARRLHAARDNSAKLSCLHAWKQERAAEQASLEFAFQKRDRKLQRARARTNALKIARDRWIQEQRVRVSYEGETLTVAEFTERRKREVR